MRGSEIACCIKAQTSRTALASSSVIAGYHVGSPSYGNHSKKVSNHSVGPALAASLSPLERPQTSSMMRLRTRCSTNRSEGFSSPCRWSARLLFENHISGASCTVRQCPQWGRHRKVGLLLELLEKPPPRQRPEQPYSVTRSALSAALVPLIIARKLSHSVSPSPCSVPQKVPPVAW